MATGDIDELRHRIEALEEESRHCTAAIDDLQRYIIQMASDFRELHQMVKATETRIERSATQVNVISRTVASLLARVEKLERSGGELLDKS